jgi:hypothetical protein
MQLVRFNRAMAPHVQGEERALPDEVAERLIAAGDAEPVPSVFDAQPEARKPRILPNLKARKTR